MIIIIFILGLCAGSAINALVWRLDKKESWIRGHSVCPKCKHKLAWYDLVPVLSFVILRGRCRYCKKKISWQYPLVELATGIIFTLIYAFSLEVNMNLKTLVTSDQLLVTMLDLLIATTLIIIFIYDLKHYLILDKVILPAIAIVFAVNVFLGKPWLEMLLSALGVSIFFLLQFLISQGKWIGGGDLRLGFFMGVVLGWPNILVALFLAYVLGSLVGIALVILKIKKMNSKVPFATFLCPATLIAVLWGEELLNWYFRLL